MAARGIDHPDTLDELEGHVRDEVERQVTAGAGMREACASSMELLGGVELLGSEFDKVDGAKAGRERFNRVFHILAGIPNSYLETNMNASTSPPNTEPRWATYLKTTVFVAPAICLWTFSVIFLVPKLQRICHETGVALPSVYRGTAFIADNLTLIVCAVVLVLALLEWRSSRWPRIRRVSLGGAVFLVNAAVLALITFMVVVALLAAPALTQLAP